MEAHAASASTMQLVGTRQYISVAIAEELKETAPRLFEKYISGRGKPETVASALSRLYQDRLLQSPAEERKQWRYEYMSVMQTQATIINACDGASARFSLQFLKSLPRKRLEALAEDNSLSGREKLAAQQLLQQLRETDNHDKMMPSQLIQRVNQLDLDETARRDSMLFACRREIRASTANGGQFLFAHAYDARSRAIATDQILRRADEQSRGTVFNALQLPVNLGEGKTLIPPLVEAEIVTTAAAAPAPQRRISTAQRLRASPLGVNESPAQVRAQELLKKRFNMLEHLFPAGGVVDYVDRTSPTWNDLSITTRDTLLHGSWQQQIQFGIRATRLMANPQNTDDIRRYNQRILRNEYGYGENGIGKIESVQWSDLSSPPNKLDVDKFESGFFTRHKLKELIKDTDPYSVFGWHNGSPDLAPERDLRYPFAFYRNGAIAGSAHMLYKYAYCMWALTGTLAGMGEGPAALSIRKAEAEGKRTKLLNYTNRKSEVEAVTNMATGGFPIAFDVNNKDDEAFYFSMGESFDFRRYMELVEGKDASFTVDATVTPNMSLRDLGRFRFSMWKPPQEGATPAIIMDAVANQRMAAQQSYSGCMNVIKVHGGDRTSRRTFLGNMARNIAGGFIAQFLTGLNTMQTIPSLPGMISTGLSTIFPNTSNATGRYIRNVLIDLAVYIGVGPAIGLLARSSLSKTAPRLRGALGVISCLTACGPTRLLVDVARNWATRYHQSPESLYAAEVKIEYQTQLTGKLLTANAKRDLASFSVRDRIHLSIAAMTREPAPSLTATTLYDARQGAFPVSIQTVADLEALPGRKGDRLLPSLAPFTDFSQLDMTRAMAIVLGTDPLYGFMPGYIKNLVERTTASTAVDKSLVIALARLDRGLPNSNLWQPSDMGGLLAYDALQEGTDLSKITPEKIATTLRSVVGILDSVPSESEQLYGQQMAEFMLSALPANTLDGQYLRDYATTLIGNPTSLFTGPVNDALLKLGVHRFIESLTENRRPYPSRTIVPDETRGGSEICEHLPDIANHFGGKHQKFACYFLHGIYERTATSSVPVIAVDVNASIPNDLIEGQRVWNAALVNVYKSLPSVAASTRRFPSSEPRARDTSIRDAAMILAGMQSWWDIGYTPDANAGPFELIAQLIMGQTGVTHRTMFEASQGRAALYSSYTRGLLFDASRGNDPTAAQVAAMFPNMAKFGKFDELYQNLIGAWPGIEPAVRPMHNLLLMTATLLTDPHARGHGFATYASLRASFGLASSLVTIFDGRSILSPLAQMPELVRSFVNAVDRTSFSWEHQFANIDLIQRVLTYTPTISPLAVSYPTAAIVNGLAIVMTSFLESFCESATDTANDYFALAQQVLRESPPADLPAAPDDRRRAIEALLEEIRPSIMKGIMSWTNLWTESASRTRRLGATAAILSTRAIYFWTLSHAGYVARWMMLPQLPFSPIVGMILQTLHVFMAQFDWSMLTNEWLKTFAGWLGDLPGVAWAGLFVFLAIVYFRGNIRGRLRSLLTKFVGPLMLLVITACAVPFTALFIDGLVGHLATFRPAPDQALPIAAYLIDKTGWLTYNFIWILPRFLASASEWAKLEALFNKILPPNEPLPRSMRDETEFSQWAYLLFGAEKTPVTQPKANKQREVIMQFRIPTRELGANVDSHFVSFAAIMDDNDRRAAGGIEWAKRQVEWRVRPGMESGIAQYDLARQNESILRDEHVQLLEARPTVESRGTLFSIPDVYGDKNWPYLKDAFADREGRLFPATGNVDGDVTLY